ncbi:hypothetical protein VRU48_09365 [Pedobacter sp. KR3-3]|uniref:Macroglobulin domain-containing protein n=1 Tax=Pedobacter albus TaxID=3113905 RepID=A0ABU7I779_9SPHI|nr:hypothetical protein [Pedobacter sp. KR3-3]MEE1945316.1 hypothetical protein [Pedobacter sp. KR3-3]
MRYLSLAILLALLSLKANAQDDPLVDRLKAYGDAKQNANLFVHFDKNVYTNYETIWFTAYLIRKSKAPINQHKLISVALIRDADSTVVIEERFPMQNGLAFGSLVLPDSLLTGNYRLLAITDRLTNSSPEALFVQPITIKTNIDAPFKASMKLIEPGSNKVLLSVTSKDNRFLPKPTMVSYKYGNFTKTAKTDASGQLLLDLPKQENISDPNLHVKLKYEKDSSLISMALPPEKSRASVKFYPEGGNLVAGLPMNIAWEVKDQFQMPIALSALLFKNNQVIDTIETSSYGIGKFRLLADADADYTVKLAHSGLIDSIYHLPKALKKGVGLSIPEALAQDSLRIGLRTNDAKKLTIRIHNFKESFVYATFEMEQHFRTIKIPLNEVPKGLNTITITDSLDRPLAERMFFAHYDSSPKLSLSTNEPSYTQRQKVSLSLKLDSKIENALVSIACVQDSRLNGKNTNDIESYTFLNNELEQLPLNVNGQAYKDKAYLEQILLVKGWRRYTWQEFQEFRPESAAFKTDSLQVIGKVTKSKKELVAPVIVGVLNAQQMGLITTRSTGLFNLNTNELMAEAGRKMYLFVNEKNKLPYKIEVDDAFSNMNAKLRHQISYQSNILPSNLLNNSELVLQSNEKAIRLKEVTITAKKDNGFTFGRGLPGSNACGDYVCRYNILNCPNHVGDSDNTQPVPGRTYMTNGHSMLYTECKASVANNGNELFTPVKGIRLQKEFYLSDYKEPQEPAFFSTIYWNYATLLKGDKATDLSFYTSDITGKFRIVVQGLTDNDVIYAERFFEVKAKQKSDP